MKYEYKGYATPYHYQEGADAYTHIVRDETGDRIICQLPQDRTGKAEATARLFAASHLLLSALIKAMEDEDNRAKTEKTDLGAGLIVDYIFPLWYREAESAIEQTLNLSPVNTQP